jgi:hypothetical protein
MPEAGSFKIYRLQTGAFRDEQNAINLFDRLTLAGLSPFYERYDGFIRVIVSGIRSSNIADVAQRIGYAGVREALIREENSGSVGLSRNRGVEAAVSNAPVFFTLDEGGLVPLLFLYERR